MLSQMTFEALQEQAKYEADNTVDWLVNTPAMRFDFEANELTCVTDSVSSPIKRLRISEIAHAQLAQTYDIPVRHYRFMRDTYPDLLADLIERVLRDDPKTRLVRELDGQCRALLSNQYLPISNAEVLGFVEEANDELETKASFLEDGNMRLQVYSPQITGEVEVGDVVRMGLCVANSEVGNGSLKLEPSIERLICTNGMVASTSLPGGHSIRHSSTRMDYDGVEATRVTPDPDREASWKKFQKSIGETITADNMARFVEQARQAMQVGFPEDADLDVFVENAAGAIGVSEKSIGGGLDHREGDTLWGFANGLTRYEQEVTSSSLSYSLQSAGNEAMNMNEGRFRRLFEE